MSSDEKKVTDELAAAISKTHEASPANFLDRDAPFDHDQRNWLNGLLTGLNAIATAAQQEGAASEEPGAPLVILYGSQSGNAEALSKDLRKFAKTQGFDANVSELDSFDRSQLSSTSHLLIICSTFGEGEPPDNAKAFYNDLMSGAIGELSNTLNYAVCGLGDSSYAQFNQCASDIDNKLSEAGANRVVNLVVCDIAFEDDYEAWKNAAFSCDAFVFAAGAVSAAEPEELGPKFDKNSPFIASLMLSENLSGQGSAKRVNHIEISLAGGADELDYAVGDALGVWPINCAQEVDAILDVENLTGRESVLLKSGPASLKAALLTKLDLTTANTNTFEAWDIERAEGDSQIIDILKFSPKAFDAQTLVNGLRPLQPRLYSIASSPNAHPGEVHLTVGEVHYPLHGTARKGVASTFLGNRLSIGGSVGVYLQRSAHFHIPFNNDAPLIMIGPGTGIAPFRAFLEEREVREAKGKNWLFFGDQHKADDFLYRDQIIAWQENGLLSHLSLAWSRDAAEKVYVQTLIKKQGAEFFDWLEGGAYVYICGDASRMASDVDKALREVIAEHGNLGNEGADAYVDKLVAEHRYQRDVY